jgi:hypothetical protein
MQDKGGETNLAKDNSPKGSHCYRIICEALKEKKKGRVQNFFL